MEGAYTDPAKVGKPEEDNSPAASIKRRSRFRDVIWIPLFLIQLFGVIGYGIWLGYQNWSSANFQRTKFTLSFWPGLLSCVGFGILYSIVFLLLLKLMPKPLLYIAIWLGPVSSAWACALAFWNGNIAFGVIFAVGFVLSLMWAIVVTKRVPFCAILIRKALQICGKLWGTWLAALFFQGIFVLYEICWTIGVSGNIARGQGKYWWVLLLAMFATFWTGAVCINLVTVTVAGSVASWYFRGVDEAVRESATLRSMGRACSFSLGSVIFGSTITALIRTLRWAVNWFKSKLSQSDWGWWLLCCIDCLIGMLESAVQFFNKYAYIQVAIYGKSFMQASRDTWDLLHARGLSALIQYDLTGSVVSLGSLVGGLLAGVIAGLVVQFGVKNSNGDGSSVLVGFMGVPVAGLTIAVLLEVVASAVLTIFVCYAEDPAILQRLEPAFLDQIRAVEHPGGMG